MDRENKALQVIETIKKHPDKAKEGLSLLKPLFVEMQNHHDYKTLDASLLALGDAAETISPDLFCEFCDTAVFWPIDVDCAARASRAVSLMIQKHPEAASQMWNAMMAHNKMNCRLVLDDFVSADKTLIPQVLSYMDTYCNPRNPNPWVIGIYGGDKNRVLKAIVNADPSYIPEVMKEMKNDKGKCLYCIDTILKHDKSLASDCFNLIELNVKAKKSEPLIWDMCSLTADCIKAEPRLSSPAFSLTKKLVGNNRRYRYDKGNDIGDNIQSLRKTKYLENFVEPLDAIISHSANEELKRKAENYKFDVILKVGGAQDLLHYAFENPLTDEQRSIMLDRCYELVDLNTAAKPGYNPNPWPREFWETDRKKYGETLGKYISTTSSLGPKSKQSIEKLYQQSPDLISKADYEQFSKRNKNIFSRLKKKLSR